MRNTQTTLHRRLKCGAAMAAAMLALAFGGPAAAQGVTGSGQFTTGTGTISTGPGTTTVTTTSNQSVLTWRLPMLTPTGAPVNFIPAGGTLNFRGSGDYVVLNRYLGLNPATGLAFDFNRQVTMLGNVISTDVTTGQRGGNIWFYNAGGFLVGSTGVFNVGGLVLTANDIDTTGGLLGPGGTIRFRGASASTAGVQIDAGATINVGNATPGSAYMAVVAPRVVQRGVVDVDGSVAYVAAEQADITINNGLFDINVLVGAEGGNVIDHSGVTTGASPIDGDGRDSRIYMVAMPKNDAVTMLVSGQIGYRDPVTAQVEPNGAIRLAAGYNIFGGEITQNPGSATAANIAMSDIIVNSAIAARASNNFDAAPVGVIPPFNPAFVPPPQLGLLRFNQNALLSGDNRSTISIGNQQGLLAAGNLALVSGGRAGAAGLTQLTLSYNPAVAGNRAAAQITGRLTLDASRVVDEFAGSDATGGTSRVSVNGGQLVAGDIELRADAVAGYGSAAQGGNAQGGTTEFIVTDAGATVNAVSLFLSAEARGGGTRENMNLGITEVANNGGSGTGGTGFISVSNGAALTTTQGMAVSSAGFGGTGAQQSGAGFGGVARLSISGLNSSVTSPFTGLSSSGTGGGAILRSPAAIDSARGGNGTGGTSEIVSNGSANLGATFLNASGFGGNATAAPHVGGNGIGGTSNVLVTGGTTTFADLTAESDGLAGGGRDLASGTAPTTHGIGTGGNVNLRTSFGGTLRVTGDVDLSAVGNTVAGPGINTLQRSGGTIELSANSGQIDIGGLVTADASAGFAPAAGAIEVSNQNAVGGTINIRAENAGRVGAQGFDLNASATTANATGTIGSARGGSVFFTANSLGQITGGALGTLVTLSGVGGSGPVGGQGLGGRAFFTANSGRIALGAVNSIIAVGDSGLSSSATAGGEGTGGLISFTVGNSGAGRGEIDVGELLAQANGSTGQFSEGGAAFVTNTGGPGQGGSISVTINDGEILGTRLEMTSSGRGGPVAASGPGGNGRGGDITVTMNGGRLEVGNVLFDASGFGGTGATGQRGGNGLGGVVRFNQTGGNVLVDSLTLISIGEGGEGGASGAGGEGTALLTHLNLTGGTFTAGTSSLISTGLGGRGGDGTATTNGGNGGRGVGGEARVTIAHPNIQSAMIANASATGGRGGDGAVGGRGGDASGNRVIFDVNNANIPDTFGITFSGSVAAQGGDGGDGSNGNGGDGGFAAAGDMLIQVRGANGRWNVRGPVLNANGTGGNGGTGAIDLAAPVPATNPAPRGGHGGEGAGGRLRFEVRGGGELTIVPDTGGRFEVSGTGGNGANGSNNLSGPGLRGGNGGNAGRGVGGFFSLLSEGGTLNSGGDFVTSGTSGVAGIGGQGTLLDANGNNIGAGIAGSRQPAVGGTIIVQASDFVTPGRINLANASFGALIPDGFGGGGSVQILNYAQVGGIRATGPLNLTTSGSIIRGIINEGVLITTGNSDLVFDGLNINSARNVTFSSFGTGRIVVNQSAAVRSFDTIQLYDTLADGSRPTLRILGNAVFESLVGGMYFDSSTPTFVDVTGNLRLSGVTDILVNRLRAGGNLELRTNASIRVNDAAIAGRDLTLVAGTFIFINQGIAGDDIILDSGDQLSALNLEALGTEDSEGDGQNIRITSDSLALVRRARTNTDFVGISGNTFDVGTGGLVAGRDVTILASSQANLNSTSAGRNLAIEATQIGFTALSAPGSLTLRTIPVTAPFASGNGAITGGTLTAGTTADVTARTGITLTGLTTGGDASLVAQNGNVTLTTPATATSNVGGNIIVRGNQITMTGLSVAGNANLDAVTRLAGRINVTGTTTLDADSGVIDLDIASGGAVTAAADSIILRGTGNLAFAGLTTDVGGASVTSGGNILVATANLRGNSQFTSTAGDVTLTQLAVSAGNLAATADRAMSLGSVSASGSVNAAAGGLLNVTGIVTGTAITTTSGDIAIGQNGRLGTLGTTQTLSVINGNRAATAFIGGTGTRNGWHLDSAEITRLFGGSVTVDGGTVTKPPVTQLGSPNPPDVIIDDFTVNAAQQLGPTGTFAITTGGKMRVIGDALFTGMVDGQSVRLGAGSALEVISGEGTVVLNGAGTNPAGVLRLESEDVIVATLAAITDVAAATTTAAINDRLALNDGIVRDAGSLVAGGIDVTVRNGFYVQNSGVQGAAGRDYANRRGLTFGALGLNITTASGDVTSIVINGQHLGPTGPVTGIDAIALISVNGVTGALTGFNPASTMNGCVIVNVAACRAGPDGFPVQDPIGNNLGGGGGSNILPIALITLRGLDPISGSPLIDDPVTGAGNEDMWTPDDEDAEEVTK